MIEEHVPLGHCTTSRGTSKGLQPAIVAYYQGNNITLDNLQVLGYDGTVVNTGSKGGAV